MRHEQQIRLLQGLMDRLDDGTNVDAAVQLKSPVKAYLYADRDTICGQKKVFSSPFHGWSHSSTPISLASAAQGSDYLSSELRACVAQPMEVQFAVDDMGEIQGDSYFVRVTQTNDAVA